MSSRQTRRGKDAPLSHDIHRLGDSLGETLKHFGGASLFDTEETIRELCKQLRERPDQNLDRRLKALLGSLKLEEAIRMCRDGRIRDAKTELALVRLRDQLNAGR